MGDLNEILAPGAGVFIGIERVFELRCNRVSKHVAFCYTCSRVVLLLPSPCGWDACIEMNGSFGIHGSIEKHRLTQMLDSSEEIRSLIDPKYTFVENYEIELRLRYFKRLNCFFSSLRC